MASTGAVSLSPEPAVWAWVWPFNHPGGRGRGADAVAGEAELGGAGPRSCGADRVRRPVQPGGGGGDGGGGGHEPREGGEDHDPLVPARWGHRDTIAREKPGLPIGRRYPCQGCGRRDGAGSRLGSSMP
jgi:hypothetical protein